MSQKLSGRMVEVLGMLFQRFWDDREAARKHLEKWKGMLASTRAAFGKSVSEEDLKVTEDDIDKELRKQSSLSLSQIIIALEKLNWKKFYKNPDQHTSFVNTDDPEIYAKIKMWDGKWHSFNNWSLRNTPSLLAVRL